MALFRGPFILLVFTGPAPKHTIITCDLLTNTCVREMSLWLAAVAGSCVADEIPIAIEAAEQSKTKVGNIFTNGDNK